MTCWTGKNKRIRRGFTLIELPAVRQRAFTLIELLVVLAIIALLTSVLVPSLGMAKELARGAKCMTNQRAVGMAIQMYAGENNGRLPGSEAWIDAILPNLGGSQPDDAWSRDRSNMPEALFCPCDDDPYPRPYMTGEMEVTSYMVNGAETDFAMGGGRKLGIGLFGGNSSIDRAGCASSCMMLGETTNYGKIVDLDSPAIQQAFADAGANVNDARTRFHHRATSGFYHNGKMAVYFADGHSDMVQGRQVDPLPPSQWPGGAMMSGSTTFYPNLSLPTAEEDPAFWGPPYTR
ncbi:MAG: type II secretion system protein [Phycisphaerae bacterium]|nr:type II secretion system protein [Phycisphaerae bacterium]